jgi:hypothetical protein
LGEKDRDIEPWPSRKICLYCIWTRCQAIFECAPKNWQNSPTANRGVFILASYSVGGCQSLRARDSTPSKVFLSSLSLSSALVLSFGSWAFEHATHIGIPFSCSRVSAPHREHFAMMGLFPHSVERGALACACDGPWNRMLSQVYCFLRGQFDVFGPYMD